MSQNNKNPFSTVRTAGLLLPIDLLARVANRDKTLPGITPSDYHLRTGEPLTEAAGRAWSVCKDTWKSFREKYYSLPASDAATTLTRNEWLLPLFQELGYGRLQTKNRIAIEDREYPVSHGWEDHVPIHLLSARYPLDKKTPGIDGAAARSPYSMMQELLNRSPERRWGFVSNGFKLYVLRDNVSLSRAANVEFDLEAIMEGAVYEDFVLLWQLCHQSRVEIQPDPKATQDSDEPPKPNPENCWLERWSKEAESRGTRALESLRDGVEQAINSLGAGFLTTPGNEALRDRLADGTLDQQEFYRQLLRTVYRLLLLLVAEEKQDEHGHNLLHPIETSKAIRKRYRQFYSVSRLRDLAGKQRGSMHVDLFESLKVLFVHLREGYEPLGIPGFGSFLFNAETATPDLDQARLSNVDLLSALNQLCFTEDKTSKGTSTRRPVDFGNMGSEELGSVYESLLELQPRIDTDEGPFKLFTASGSERKTSGSYYTPRSLINCLLDSALDPVVHAAIDKSDPREAEAALLDLKICDPAAGSGHFLIAAAERMAMHLASLRTGDDQPTTLAIQHAKRDIIGRCIYGVDINPMSVELCKVSLWMEALEPGRPLSFLDHHIQCGNSLLGTTPALLADGIPNDAFKPIEGDVKASASALKKQNTKERKDWAKGQIDLFEPYIKLGNMPAEYAKLAHMDDQSLEGIAEKQRLYQRLMTGADYLNARLLADAWCAVFVWKKDESDLGKMCPTENDFHKIENNPHDILPHVRAEVQRLAGLPENGGYQFFHWHLAFPDVFVLPEAGGKAENEQTGWSRGFDVVLGNPPWEHTELKTKEWFANRSPEIANAKTGAMRSRMINELGDSDPELYREFFETKRKHDLVAQFASRSGAYPFCGRGRINLYALFAERCTSIGNAIGRMGVIIPTGIATDNTTRFFFGDLITKRRVVSIYDFWNRLQIFKGVQPKIKFCLLTVSNTANDTFSVAAQLEDVPELQNPQLRYQLSAEDVRKINPNTMNCPIFASRRDAELTKFFYAALPLLQDESLTETNDWDISFRQGLFNMTSDSHLFRTQERLQTEGYVLAESSFEKESSVFVPLYEAKLMHQFDHRAATFAGVLEADRFKTHAWANDPTIAELRDPEFGIIPRFWVPRDEVEAVERSSDWHIAFRDVISTVADSRCFVASIIPPYGAGHTLPIVRTSINPRQCAVLVGLFNSFAMDYVVRQKASGSHLNFYIVRQLPIPDRGNFDGRSPWEIQPLLNWIANRVLELTYTAWDLEAFAVDCGYDGPPFRWDEERRFLLRCELNAAYFHLYLGSPAEWGRSSEPNETVGQSSVVSGQETQSGQNENTDNQPLTTANPAAATVNSELLEMFPTPRHAVEYIMETFPIVKRKDVKAHGDYRTKLTILNIYDQMQTAIETGDPYQTQLDPAPGPPCTADGQFEPFDEWTDEIRTTYADIIHPPRDQQPTFRQLRRDRGEKILILRLLLAKTNSAVHQDALELMLLFALNDGLRQRIAEQRPATTPTDVKSSGVRWLPGLQGHLEALKENGIVDIEVRNDASFITLVDNSGLDGTVTKSLAPIIDQAISAFEVIKTKREADAADRELTELEIRTLVADYVEEGEFETLDTL